MSAINRAVDTQLADEVFRLCIRRDVNGELVWDEDGIFENWATLDAAANECFNLTEKKPDIICALGKSGVALAASIAIRRQLPLIWVDRVHRLSPGSYIPKLRGKRITLIDSHTLYFWSATIGVELVRSAYANPISLHLLVNPDHLDEKEPQSTERRRHRGQIPKSCDVAALLPVSRHWDKISGRLQNLDGKQQSADQVREILSRERFWRRPLAPVYSSVSGETDTLEELDPVRLRLPTLDERLGLKVQNLLKDPRNRKWIDSWRLYQNVELAKSVADTVVKNWDECTGGRDIDYIVSVSELGIPFAMYVAYAAREHKKFHGNVLRCDPAAPVSGRWLFPDIGVGTLKDKNVLLVDEIMTSGSHARAAAELFLLQAKSHLAGFVVLLQNEGEYNFSNIRKLTEMVPNAISVAGTSLSGLGAWARRQGLFIRF